MKVKRLTSNFAIISPLPKVRRFYILDYQNNRVSPTFGSVLYRKLIYLSADDFKMLAEILLSTSEISESFINEISQLTSKMERKYYYEPKANPQKRGRKKTKDT
jgi:hypothetical protein